MFYIIKSTDENNKTTYSWIEWKDPYSEGHGWFDTIGEARLEAYETLRGFVAEVVLENNV